MPDIPDESPKISDRSVTPVHSPAAEYQSIAAALVRARQDEGRQRVSVVL